jgi:hypothetical protein
VERLRRILSLLFAAIAAYDVGTGGWLLLSDTPWRAHGADTVWCTLADRGADPAIESLFRRIGALQILAGGVTLGFLWLARRDPRALDVMLLLYAVVGVALAWTDHAFFDGTAYASAKTAVGALCGVGMLAWAVVRWSSVATSGYTDSGTSTPRRSDTPV